MPQRRFTFEVDIAMHRASYVSIFGAFALIVLASIINVACTSDVNQQDQGVNESNLESGRGYGGHGYGYGGGYGYYGAGANLAPDRAH